MNRRLPARLMGALVGLAILTAGRAEDPAAKKVLPVEQPVVRSLSFSPDGSLLAAAVMPRDRDGLVLVWDVASRKPVAKYDRVGESPMAAFASDGKSIVVANGRKVLVVLDPKSGEKTSELGPFPAEIANLVPAGPGKWVTLGKDFTFHVWDEKEKKVTREFGGLKRVWGWAVSPGGRWLFANGDGVDKLWDLTTGDEAASPVKPQPGRASAVTFLSDDRMLLGSNYGSHRVIEVPSGKEVLRFKNEGGTEGLAYSPTAEMMASRYYTSTVFSLAPLTFRPPTDAQKARVAALLKECDSDDYPTREKAAAALAGLGPAIEPLLKAAMTEGPSAEVRMRARVARETILNKPKFQLSGHTEEIRPGTFAPDGKVFATGGADGQVILWDPATGKELARLKAE